MSLSGQHFNSKSMGLYIIDVEEMVTGIKKTFTKKYCQMKDNVTSCIDPMTDNISVKYLNQSNEKPTEQRITKSLNHFAHRNQRNGDKCDISAFKEDQNATLRKRKTCKPCLELDAERFMNSKHKRPFTTILVDDNNYPSDTNQHQFLQSFNKEHLNIKRASGNIPRIKRHPNMREECQMFLKDLLYKTLYSSSQETKDNGMFNALTNKWLRIKRAQKYCVAVCEMGERNLSSCGIYNPHLYNDAQITGYSKKHVTHCLHAKVDKILFIKSVGSQKNYAKLSNSVLNCALSTLSEQYQRNTEIYIIDDELTSKIITDAIWHVPNNELNESHHTFRYVFNCCSTITPEIELTDMLTDMESLDLISSLCQPLTVLNNIHARFSKNDSIGLFHSKSISLRNIESSQGTTKSSSMVYKEYLINPQSNLSPLEIISLKSKSKPSKCQPNNLEIIKTWERYIDRLMLCNGHCVGSCDCGTQSHLQHDVLSNKGCHNPLTTTTHNASLMNYFHYFLKSMTE